MKIITQEARDTNNIKKRIESIIESIKLKKQIALIIEICSKCNLSCNFCDLHSNKVKGLDDQKGIMDEKLYYKIIEDISNLGYKLKALHFHGWGEPLIQKKLPEMIHYAYKKGVAEKYVLITNGTLMNEKMFDKLLVSGLDEIRISLDTVDPEQYVKIKGRNLLQRVLYNIDYAISKISTQTKMNLYIKIPGTASDSSFGIRNEDTQKVINKFKNINNPNVSIILQPLVVTINENIRNYKPCEQVFYTSIVRFNGSVCACCVDIYDNLKIGNIAKQSLSEILNGEKLRQIRKIHIENRIEEIPQCVNCGFRTSVDISSYSEEIKKYL